MPNHTKDKDDIKFLKEDLVSQIKEGRLRKEVSKYKTFSFALGVIVIIQLIIVGSLYITSSNYYKTIQYHNMVLEQMYKDLIDKDVRKQALLEIEKVALHYNPKFRHQSLQAISQIIYDTGVLTYKIPLDELLLLFTYESEWNPNAKSQYGALGLGQIVPESVSYVVKDLGLPFTLLDPVVNVKVTLKYYFELKCSFQENAYIAYCFGPTYFRTHPKSKEYGSFKKTLRKRVRELESILGRPLRVTLP